MKIINKRRGWVFNASSEWWERNKHNPDYESTTPDPIKVALIQKLLQESPISL